MSSPRKEYDLMTTGRFLHEGVFRSEISQLETLRSMGMQMSVDPAWLAQLICVLWCVNLPTSCVLFCIRSLLLQGDMSFSHRRAERLAYPDRTRAHRIHAHRSRIKTVRGVGSCFCLRCMDVHTAVSYIAGSVDRDNALVGSLENLYMTHPAHICIAARTSIFRAS